GPGESAAVAWHGSRISNEIRRGQSDRVWHHLHRHAGTDVLPRDAKRFLLNALSLRDALSADATACCAFCNKALPVVNGQLQPWRVPSGLFFCNEFCADDAEEASFQKHLVSHRR